MSAEQARFGRSLGYVPPMTCRRLIGRWRIVEMDLWGRDALDLVEPAYFEFDDRGRGYFGFIAQRGHFFFHAGDDSGFLAVRDAGKSSR